MLYFRIMFHRAWCYTRSKAFFKSTNTWYTSLWCCWYFSQSMHRLKIYSVVLIPSLKPACSSAMMFSACGFCLFSRTLSITLLGWLMRLMVRQFEHCWRLPFFGSVMTRDGVHVVGHCPVCQILLQIFVRTSMVMLPPCLMSSDGM